MAKSTFRETMWFKLGAPAPAGAGAAAETNDDGDEAEPSATAAMLPIEDRYCATDLTAEDTAQYGLHIGTTQAIGIDRAEDAIASADDVEMSTLARELKPRARIFAVGAGACALVAAFVMYRV